MNVKVHFKACLYLSSEDYTCALKKSLNCEWYIAAIYYIIIVLDTSVVLQKKRNKSY